MLACSLIGWWGLGEVVAVVIEGALGRGGVLARYKVEATGMVRVQGMAAG